MAWLGFSLPPLLGGFKVLSFCLRVGVLTLKVLGFALDGFGLAWLGLAWLAAPFGQL